MKKELPNNWYLLNWKIAYPYEYFKQIEEYSKDISNLTKQDYFSKLKNGYPDDIEIERTNKIIETLMVKNGKELTQLYFNSDFRCNFVSWCFWKIYNYFF